MINDSSKTEISAGAVVFHITADNSILYLLLQPGPRKAWGFPKGRLDSQETDMQAACREIEEETGLRELEFAEDFRHIVHYQFKRGRWAIQKEVIYFLAHSHSQRVRISHEHIAYRWMSLEEAFRQVVFESTRELLHYANSYILANFPPLR